MHRLNEFRIDTASGICNRDGAPRCIMSLCYAAVHCCQANLIVDAQRSTSRRCTQSSWAHAFGRLLQAQKL